MKFLTNCAACAAPLTHHDIPTSCVATKLRMRLNMANCLAALNRKDEALATEREAFAMALELKTDPLVTSGLLNALSISLLNKGEFAEVKSLIRANLPLAERALGSTHDVTFRLYMNLGEALYFDPRRSRDDVVEAGAILKGAAKASKRTCAARPLGSTLALHSRAPPLTCSLALG